MLKDIVAAQAASEGLTKCKIDNVDLYRLSHPYQRLSTLLTPTICIVLQGRKTIFLGDETLHIDRQTILIATARMPIESQLVGVSPQHPALGIVMHIDPALLSNLLLDYGEFADWEQEKEHRFIATCELTPAVSDALARLLAVQDRPADLKILGRALLRECYYRILTGPNGSILRNCAAGHAKVHRIASIIRHMEDHLAESIEIRDITGFSGMSSSNLHDLFKKYTSLSPMQFLKRLRLHNAHTLLTTGSTVTEAALRSGYNSTAQFSREFKRLFGTTPSEKRKLRGNQASAVF